MLEHFGKITVEQVSPLVLAYIGDAVYDLYVRTLLVTTRKDGVNGLHKAATGHVRCSAQSESFRKLEKSLTDEELAVYKRGRNAKSSVPKNASVADYRTATGLEALLGYIYLKGREDRLFELFDIIMGG